MKRDAHAPTPQRALDRAPDGLDDRRDDGLDDVELAPESQLDLQLNLWPDHWAWEDDNQADGDGVGPFAARKPPKRADRPRPGAIDPTED
jgi:hypothetical protein